MNIIRGKIIEIDLDRKTGAIRSFGENRIKFSWREELESKLLNAIRHSFDVILHLDDNAKLEGFGKEQS